MKILKKYIVPFVFLAGIIGLAIFNIKKNESFWLLNAFEIFTLIIALIFAYYFVQRDKKVFELKNRYVEVIDELLKKTNSSRIRIPKLGYEKNSLLSDMRYISNSIELLKKYQKVFNCSKEISFIELQWHDYKMIVSENIDDQKYVLSKRERITSILENIDIKLQELRLKLFSEI